MKRLALHRHLADEEGVALAIVVLIIAIITIAAASAIFYTDGSQRDAFSKKGAQTAYSLAQAAISNATAQLTSHYYDSSGQPKDNSTSLDAMAGWAPSGSQQSPINSSSCVTTSPISTCMEWAGVLCQSADPPDCPTYPDIMPVTGPEKAAWHITGTGTVPNPSGTQPITRTITVYVPVTAPPRPTHFVPDIYQSVYSGGTGQPCDMDMVQKTIFYSPVYVLGNLCIQQPQAGVYSPGGSLAVGGYLYLPLGSAGGIGTSSAPIADLKDGTAGVKVRQACGQTQSTTPACSLTDSGKGYWTDGKNIYSKSQVSNSPTFPAPPDQDFAVMKQQSQPYTCTPTSVETLATNPFDLTPTGGDYSCKAGVAAGTQSGSISWNHSTKTLTVSGDVYIFGDVVTNNGPSVLYSGIGGIFVDGSIAFSNNTVICAAPNGFTGTHDCAGGYNFDTSKDLLMLFAQYGISGANLGLQGGLYAKYGDINFSSGQTNIYGPMVTEYGSLVPGQQATSGHPDIQDVISGWFLAPQPFWELGPPTAGTY